jgi:hypothetical protein
MAKKAPYRHAENITWRKVGDEGVLLNLDSSVYYSLNEPGILVWERLGEGDDVDAAAAAVCARFDGPEAQVRKDVASLVADLLEKGLLLRA